jgi:ferredoxin
MSYFRVNDRCNGCLACVQNCPASALDYEDLGNRRTLRHNMSLCARCGQCWRICPQQAIEFQHFLKSAWDEVVNLDLVRCGVCGEALYTVPFKQTVTERRKGEVDPFCPKHRREVDALVRAHFRPGPGFEKR